MIPAYPGISVPVEILHGTADTTVFAGIHAERLVTEVPGAVLHLLPGHGHMIQHSAEDEVVAAIERAAARVLHRADN
jgi:pimeloyl-ACP methyl ester carboxylesterase